MPSFRSAWCGLRGLVWVLLTGVCVGWLLVTPAHAHTATRHDFFSHTQYPLTVHVIEGKHPGPTVMVQGGVQGDETAGYVTAHLLTRSRVTHGRLIVIPRANVPSILARARQINVDLNRRFDQNYNAFYEDRLARVIRHFLAQSDAFIHLHEGWGFHSPTYVSEMRNPSRYGQSIIIDTREYDASLRPDPATHEAKPNIQPIRLAESVQTVLEQLNASVHPSRYRFELFNTDTLDPQTSFPEMLKSLTCYALIQHRIPALAIEVSKDIIQLDWKVRQQFKATRLFLEHYGVRIDATDVLPDDATLRNYPASVARPALAVNGQTDLDKPITLTPYEALDIRTALGDQHHDGPVSGVYAADRPGVNLLNAPRIPLAPFSHLEVRADGKTLSHIPVRWEDAWFSARPDGHPLFVCWLNGELHVVPAGGTLHAVEGDALIVEGIWGGQHPGVGPDKNPGGGHEEVLNVKGLVTQTRRESGVNTGQDAGQEIILDRDIFMQRYLEPVATTPDSFTVRIARETKGQQPAEMTVQVTPRRIQAIRIARLTPALTSHQNAPDSELLAFTPGGTHTLAPGTYRLDTLFGNASPSMLLAYLGDTRITSGNTFTLADGPLRLTLRQATTFQSLGTLTLLPGGSHNSTDTTTLAQK